MGNHSEKNKERGVALVLTIWVITILMVAATYFAYGSKWDMRLAAHYEKGTFAYYLAKSAVTKARYFLSDETLFPEWEDFRILPGAFELPVEEREGGGIHAVVMDLEGLVNINRAPLEMLRTLLINTGSEYDEAERLADCILDWRDVDTQRRANGAEDEEYLALPDGYPSKDAPFDSVEELLLVMGMTNEIFYGDSVLAAMRGEEYRGEARYLGLGNFVTVYGRGRINVNSADPIVLTCLPGMTEETARSIVARRSEEGGEFGNVTEIVSLLEQTGEPSEIARGMRGQISVYSYYYLITGTGRIGETESVLEAVVYRYGKNSKILPRIVAWREIS